jgi:hypothetical protein
MNASGGQKHAKSSKMAARNTQLRAACLNFIDNKDFKNNI